MHSYPTPQTIKMDYRLVKRQSFMDHSRFHKQILLGKDFRSGKRWAAPANPQKENSTNLIGNLKTTHLSFHQTEMPAGDARLNVRITKKKEPPPKCRVGRSLNLGSKWAPLSFFRLF